MSMPPALRQDRSRQHLPLKDDRPQDLHTEICIGCTLHRLHPSTCLKPPTLRKRQWVRCPPTCPGLTSEFRGPNINKTRICRKKLPTAIINPRCEGNKCGGVRRFEPLPWCRSHGSGRNSVGRWSQKNGNSSVATLEKKPMRG